MSRCIPTLRPGNRKTLIPRVAMGAGQVGGPGPGTLGESGAGTREVGHRRRVFSLPLGTRSEVSLGAAQAALGHHESPLY